MAKAKGEYIVSLAEQAQADLEKIKIHKVVVKLKAISAIAKFPAEVVAEVMDVAVQTVWRWVAAYKKDGLDGLYPKPKRPKPSKLNPEQKAIVLSWLDNEKTPEGENTHWTLSHLRHAITEEFGVVLGINTIWVWLRKEGLKLKVPRLRHHSADVQAQKDF
jgi:transposase